MDSPYMTGRVLLPKVEPLEPRGRLSIAHTFIDSLATSESPVPPKCRQRKSATKTDQEWEDQKPTFLRLYVEDDLPLQEVMKKMEDEYQFKASYVLHHITYTITFGYHHS